MEDYKANSHKAKAEQMEERKKLEPVVKGKVTKKKQSAARKLTDTFVSEDIHNVKSYVIMDVLIPAAKKAISDIVTNGIDMILYGETGKSRKRSNSDYISYNRYSDRNRDRDDRYSDRTRSGYSYDDIVLETRGEAMDVIERMDEIIDTYGVVSVADMYDLVDVSSNYTDNKYGWTNLRNAEPVRVRDGYIIRLPKAKPIN